MDLDELIVGAFCTLDDALKEVPASPLRTRGPAPVLADSEVLTLEYATLQRILERDPPLATAHALMQQFRRVVGARDVAGLSQRLIDAQASRLAPFVGFVHGVAADRDAVVAAFTLPWSTGPAEGNVHKIKLLKRQAYGRACLPQLRARVLAA